MSSTSSSPLSSSGRHELTVPELVGRRAGREWCLFVDRDGVINRQIIGDYVRNWTQFEWLPSSEHALNELRAWAPHLVVVTNQQGVGKGLMTEDEVVTIHQNLLREVASSGAAIDCFLVCPHLETARCACRKPNPGLVLGWLEANPEVDPSLSVMVGDSASDFEMARNVAAVTGGCASIRIGHTSPPGGVDATFDSLWDFANTVRDVRGKAL